MDSIEEEIQFSVTEAELAEWKDLSPESGSPENSQALSPCANGALTEDKNLTSSSETDKTWSNQTKTNHDQPRGCCDNSTPRKSSKASRQKHSREGKCPPVGLAMRISVKDGAASNGSTEERNIPRSILESASISAAPVKYSNVNKHPIKAGRNTCKNKLEKEDSKAASNPCNAKETGKLKETFCKEKASKESLLNQKNERSCNSRSWEISVHSSLGDSRLIKINSAIRKDAKPLVSKFFKPLSLTVSEVQNTVASPAVTEIQNKDAREDKLTGDIHPPGDENWESAAKTTSTSSEPSHSVDLKPPGDEQWKLEKISSYSDTVLLPKDIQGMSSQHNVPSLTSGGHYSTLGNYNPASAKNYYNYAEFPYRNLAKCEKLSNNGPPSQYSAGPLQANTSTELPFINVLGFHTQSQFFISEPNSGSAYPSAASAPTISAFSGAAFQNIPCANSNPSPAYFTPSYPNAAPANIPSTYPSSMSTDITPSVPYATSANITPAFTSVMAADARNVYPNASAGPTFSSAVPTSISATISSAVPSSVSSTSSLSSTGISAAHDNCLPVSNATTSSCLTPTAASGAVKAVTHPLLPSTQKPLLIPNPLKPKATLNSSTLRASEHKLLIKLLEKTKVDADSSLDFKSILPPVAPDSKPSQLTTPKGLVALSVENVPKDLGLLTMKNVFQVFGRLPSYNIHESSSMRSPTAKPRCAKLTVTFANIESASRAVRVLSLLSINDCKLSVKYKDNIEHPRSLSKLEAAREKRLRKIVSSLITKANPAVRLCWVDDDLVDDPLFCEKIKTEAKAPSISPEVKASESPVTEADSTAQGVKRRISGDTVEPSPRSFESQPGSESSGSPRCNKSPANCRHSKSPVYLGFRSSSSHRRSRGPSYRRTSPAFRRRSRSPAFRRRSRSSASRRRSRSPASRRRSRSPASRRRSRSPASRRRSRSPASRRRSRSPASRRRSRSPASRCRSRSPASRRRNRSPASRRRSRSSASRRRSRSSASRRRSRSPASRRRSRSPTSRRRSRSPASRRRSRSPASRRRSRSPASRRRSRSPASRRSSRSPASRRSSRSPASRRSSRSPASRRSSRSPASRRRSRSPASRRRRRSPYRQMHNLSIKKEADSSVQSRDPSLESRHSHPDDSLHEQDQCNLNGKDNHVKGSAPITLEDFQNALVSQPQPLVGDKDFNVKISGGAVDLSHVAVNELNYNFGGNLDPYYDDGWLLQVPDPLQAAALVRLLHRYRLLDGVLQASLCSSAGPSVTVSDADVEACRPLTQRPLDLHNKAAAQVIARSLEQVLDVFSYKLEPCTAANCDALNCIHYHSRKDRRRDPRKFFYRSVKCPAAWEEGGRCVRGQRCGLCHSEPELLLHPDRLRVALCPALPRCAAPLACSHLHPGTPDMFYHALWEDLYVEGLHNTVPFIAGAIRNLHKLEGDASSGVQVLAAFTDAGVCSQAAALLDPLALRHGVKVSCIVTGTEDPRDCHVVLGTLQGVLTLLEARGAAPLVGLRALLLDDMAALFMHRATSQAFRALQRFVEAVHAAPETINKVGVCERVKDVDVLMAKEVFSKQLKIIRRETDSKESVEALSTGAKTKPVESNQLPTSCISSASEDKKPAKVQEETASQPTERSQLPVLSLDEESQNPTKKLKTENADTKNNAESIIEKTQDIYDLPSLTETDGSFLKSFLEEEKALRLQFEEEFSVFIEVPELHPNYEEKYEEFLLVREKTNSFSDIEEDWNRFWRLEMAEKKRILWIEKLGALVEKFKRAAEKEQIHESREMTPEVPLISPTSEPKFETLKIENGRQAPTVPFQIPNYFQEDISPEASNHSVKNSSQSDNGIKMHKPSVIGNIGTSRSAVNTPHISDIPGPSRASELKNSSSHVDVLSNFTMEKALQVFLNVNQYLGFLGNALARLFQESQSKEPPGFYDLFLDQDSITLYKLCAKKLQADIPSLQSPTRKNYELAILYLDALPKYAEKQLEILSKTPKVTEKDNHDHLGLDVKAIAKATEGKSSSFIVDFIQCTLNLQGKSATKQELSKVFIAVSELHFNMSLSKSTGSPNRLVDDSNCRDAVLKEPKGPKTIGVSDVRDFANRDHIPQSGLYKSQPMSTYELSPHVGGSQSRDQRHNFDDISVCSVGEARAEQDNRGSAFHSSEFTQNRNYTASVDHHSRICERTDITENAHSFRENHNSKSSVVYSAKMSAKDSVLKSESLLSSDVDSLKQLLRNALGSSSGTVSEQSCASTDFVHENQISGKYNIHKYVPVNNSFKLHHPNSRITIGNDDSVWSGQVASSSHHHTEYSEGQTNYQAFPPPGCTQTKAQFPNDNEPHLSYSRPAPRISYVQGISCRRGNSTSQAPESHLLPISENSYAQSKPQGNVLPHDQSSSIPSSEIQLATPGFQKTWFSEKVKSIINISGLTLHTFNSRLANILCDKPVNYKFSRSDLRLVKELQELGSVDIDENLFLSTLKVKFGRM